MTGGDGLLPKPAGVPVVDAWGPGGADTPPRGEGGGLGGLENGELVSGGTGGPAGDDSGWPGIPGWRGSVIGCWPLSGLCQNSGSFSGIFSPAARLFVNSSRLQYSRRSR